MWIYSVGRSAGGLNALFAAEGVPNRAGRPVGEPEPPPGGPRRGVRVERIAASSGPPGQDGKAPSEGLGTPVPLAGWYNDHMASKRKPPAGPTVTFWGATRGVTGSMHRVD